MHLVRHIAPLLLAVILTAQLMVVLDTTIVNVALPHIQQDLGFSTSALSWVLNAYILTFGGFLLLGARAGDLFGRRRVFLLGIAVFTISSLLGGLAVSGWTLLAARALQGVGAALAAPSCALPPDDRLRRGPGAGPGHRPLHDGLRCRRRHGPRRRRPSHPARFVAVGHVRQRPDRCRRLARGRVVLVETEHRHGHFDLLGAITCTLGVTGVVLGLVEAGAKGWTSPAAHCRPRRWHRVAGVCSSTSRAAPRSRSCPLRLLTHGTRNSANAARALLYAGFYGLFYFMAQFLQDVQGYRPLRAGVAFVPMPASVFLASQLTSRVLLRRLPEKAVMMMGTVIAIVGLLAGHSGRRRHQLPPDRPSLVLIGAGSGMTFVSLTSASLADVEPEIAGAASGLVNVSQQLGAAVGLAVLVTVFNALAGKAQLSTGVGRAPSCIPSTPSSGWLPCSPWDRWSRCSPESGPKGRRRGERRSTRSMHRAEWVARTRAGRALAASRSIPPPRGGVRARRLGPRDDDRLNPTPNEEELDGQAAVGDL